MLQPGVVKSQATLPSPMSVALCPSEDTAQRIQRLYPSGLLGGSSRHLSATVPQRQRGSLGVRGPFCVSTGMAEKAVKTVTFLRPK